MTEETFEQKRARLKRVREAEKAAKVEEVRRKKEEDARRKQEEDATAATKPPVMGTPHAIVDTEFVKVPALPKTFDELHKFILDIVVQQVEAAKMAQVLIPPREISPEYQAGTPAFKDAILKLVTTLNPAEHPGMEGIITRAQKWKRTSFVKDVLDIITIHMQQGGYL